MLLRRDVSVGLVRIQLSTMGCVVLAFVAISATAALVTRSIGADADLIAGRVLVGLGDGIALRAAIDPLDVDLEVYVRGPERGDRTQRDRLANDRRVLDARLARGAASVDSADVRALFAEANEHAKSACDRSDEAVAAVEGGEFAAAEKQVDEERRESRRAGEAIGRLVAFEARRAAHLALEVKSARRKGVRWTFLLDSLVGLTAVVAAAMASVGLRKAVRRLQASELVAERRAILLQERSSELETYAGRVAHDILSPLDAVGVGLHLSKQRLADDAVGVATIDRSTRSLTRIQATVSDLLEFARAGADPIDGAGANLRDGIEGVLDDLATEAQRAGVQMVVEPFRDCRVACSPGVLSSLLGNLVHNAIKYMGPAARRCVTVRAAQLARRVRVQVEDTGPGVPEDMQRLIFEPFVRIERRSVPGLGLGLATVRKLALTHGGDAACQSSPGAGSIFWFELPVRPGPADGGGRLPGPLAPARVAIDGAAAESDPAL